MKGMLYLFIECNGIGLQKNIFGTKYRIAMTWKQFFSRSQFRYWNILFKSMGQIECLVHKKD